MTRASPFSPHSLAYLTEARSVPIAAIVAVELAVCLSKWARRRHTRRALKQLTVWQLEDVGLTPLQAHNEAAKVFWRP